MVIGIPKEIKDNEYRVGIVPAGVKELAAQGHQVLIEVQAGLGSGITDEEYQAAGATILTEKSELFGRASLIIKVKEPQPSEYTLLREGQIVFAFLHLAPFPQLTADLLSRKIIGIAYETIQQDDDNLPLLAPMSEVAGRMSVQVGAGCLQKDHGGAGVLLGGVPGVPRGLATILGGGRAGLNAAQMAVGTGARVTVIDINPERLRYLENLFGGRVDTLMSNIQNISASVRNSDLVVGAVLIPGCRAPHLVSREMIAKMRPGSVVVDISVDQGGCVETSRPTTHSNPTYIVDDVIHYCVANIPGIVPRTSTFALANATLPYAVKIANYGAAGAAGQDQAIARGINLYKGRVTHQGVAAAQGLPYREL